MVFEPRNEDEFGDEFDFELDATPDELNEADTSPNPRIDPDVVPEGNNISPMRIILLGIVVIVLLLAIGGFVSLDPMGLFDSETPAPIVLEDPTEAPVVAEATEESTAVAVMPTNTLAATDVPNTPIPLSTNTAVLQATNTQQVIQVTTRATVTPLFVATTETPPECGITSLNGAYNVRAAASQTSSVVEMVPANQIRAVDAIVEGEFYTDGSGATGNAWLRLSDGSGYVWQLAVSVANNGVNTPDCFASLPLILQATPAPIVPTATASASEAAAMAASFTEPIGEATEQVEVQAVADVSAQSVSGVTYSQAIVATPTVVPIAVAQAVGSNCPVVDTHAVIDPSGAIFPSWDGHWQDTDFSDELSPWPALYVGYEGNEAQPNADAPITRQIQPGAMLIGAGGATQVTGDVNLLVEEDANTFAIFNNSANVLTVNVAPTVTNTFIVDANPFAGVDSVRAALSFYAGQLLADNSTLSSVGFYAIAVENDGTLVLQGTYVRDCGTISGVNASALDVVVTPVTEDAWNTYVVPGFITVESRTLDTQVIEQAEASNFGCEQLALDTVSNIQCSSQGEVDGTFVIQPNYAVAMFGARSEISQVMPDGTTEIVYVPEGFNADLTVIVNTNDQPLTLSVDSNSFGYVVTATTIRGEWSPESIQSWVNHLSGVSLNPDGEVYNDSQTADFGVSLPTAVPPCGDETEGCLTTELGIWRWNGVEWQLLAHGIYSDQGIFVETPLGQ